LSLHAVGAIGAQHLGRRNSPTDILSVFISTIKQLRTAIVAGQFRTAVRASVMSVSLQGTDIVSYIGHVRKVPLP
jgi:hypothetical protein